MNDIKLSELGNIDYIPNDGLLCETCVHYHECPWHYVCETVERTRKWEAEL